MYSAIVSFDNILVNMTSLPDSDLPSPTAASGDTRVVHLVDDSAEARRLVECQLEDAGWKIRSYESGQAFLKECGAHSRGCIILDLQMPGMSGSELQQLLGSRQITMPVIFLAATANVKMTAEVMKRGAMDLIEKPFEAAELAAAVQRAMAADLAAETARVESASARERIGRLTTREYEVLDCVVRGMANKQVARELNISERTVENHRARGLSRINVESIPDLVRLWAAARSDNQNV